MSEITMYSTRSTRAKVPLIVSLMAAALVTACGGASDGSSIVDTSGQVQALAAGGVKGSTNPNAADQAQSSSSTPTPPPPTSGSGTALISWTAPATLASGDALGTLSGYRVYYGQESGTYSGSVFVAADISSTTVTGLAAGNWFFAVTAVDSSGNESSTGYELSKTL